MSDNQRVFNTERDGNILIVSPTGDQIGFQLGRIREESEAIANGIDGKTIRHVLFDAGGEGYISSVVIGAMIQMWEVALEHGGRFVICNISEGALEAIAAMRLDTKWPRYESREEALAGLRDE